MDLEQSIVELLSKNPEGINNKMLLSEYPNSAAQVVEVLNNLTSAEKIQIFHKNKQLIYKLKAKQEKNCKGADVEEKVIYQLIEKAGNKGIWIRTLRYSSNLPQAQVNKIVKSLESKKLIKSVTSVAAAKKKVYMLYNIEPDSSVTGGTWYSDQEFESEFVDVLNQQCYRFLAQAKARGDTMSDPISQWNASYRTSADICDYINGLKVSKVELSVQDIESILNTLIYDGKIEKRVVALSNDETINTYRDAKPLIPNCALMKVPCGTCPVYQDCQEGTVISPTNCPYIQEWLEF